MWIDCHCHTRYSNDNYLEPLDLVRRALAIGLDGVVITEHHSVVASEPVERIGREEGLMVLRGVEISTDQGHLLAFGIEDDAWNVWGRNNYIPLGPVIERINGLGGICVPAHPFREIGLASLLEGLLDLQDIVAVETHNGGNLEADNVLAITAAGHMGLPGLGGSDCHKVEAVGRCATEFTQPVTDMASFVAAVRAGACRGAYFPGFALT
ncbi:MAG: PHP domain-containing protein [Rhodocyclaceae bacterium]|nr:PHP domain-containing protein [Rhodocyclaceae bacterium]